MRPKTSPIWNVPIDQFKLVVLAAESMGGILTYFGLANKGGNYKTVRRRCKELGIDLASLDQKWRANVMSKIHFKVKRPIVEYLVAGSSCDRQNIKRRLIQEGLIANKCSICGQAPNWNGMDLVLILDHINGDSTDNRLVNLRLLCPNCNSQQPTFAGRNNKHVLRRPPNKCKCGKTIGRHSLQCMSCNAHGRRVVVARPSTAKLAAMVTELGYEAVGRKYGVSGNTIKHWRYPNVR